MNRWVETLIVRAGLGSHERLTRYAICVVLGALLVAMPSFGSDYATDMAMKILIYGIFATSLNLLVGYLGLFSLGHAAFFGVGAYTAAVLLLKCGIGSIWILMPAGVLAALVCAAVSGFLALRVSGVYFILVTLAVAQLFVSLALSWRPVTGGSNGTTGIPYPDIGLSALTLTSATYYYVVLIFFLICLFLMYRLVKSPFGRAMEGIRGDERRMRCLGYDTWLHKYITFGFGGLFAGAAGVLMAFQNGVVVPGHLGATTSMAVSLMVILGSDRVFWGPVLGAALMVLLEYFTSVYAPERWPLILGAVFVVVVMFVRGGVALYLTRMWHRMMKGNAGS